MNDTRSPIVTSPLIVTLQIDADSFGWLNELRHRHFPPARNLIPAHLTLFHKLDDVQVARIAAALASTPTPPIPLTFPGLRSLGRGVAVEVASSELRTLHAMLVATVGGDLTPQDRQPFRPHVTIQNKVDPADAKALLSELTDGFVVRHGRGEGLCIWRYLGGPWSLHARLPFAT